MNRSSPISRSRTRRSRSFRRAMLGVLLAFGCGSYRPARFADAPVVTSVSDGAPIPVPAFHEFSEIAYLNDTYLRRPIVAAMEVERIPPAADANSTDDVPRSSWFSPVPMEEIRRSCEAEGGPWPPFVVEPGETLSEAGGLRVRDARGIRYELHHDPKNLPASTTAVKAISSRLVRALGYRTPEVWIVAVSESDLIVTAKTKSLTRTIDKFLASAPAPDTEGKYRMSATRWPRGIDVGHSDASGTRSDDPNDRIPHEDRRTLRALHLVAAWLALDRLSPENTRDVYEGEPDEGHLVHYVVGFEYSLGVTHLRGIKARRFPAGQVKGNVFRNFVTLGFAPPRGARKLRTLGDLDPNVDPSKLAATYEPAVRLAPDDAYWIAKRMASLPISVVEWAVEQGKLPSMDVSRRLTDAIVSRREAVVRSAYQRVTPLEPLRLGLMRAELVLEDEAIRGGFATVADTEYAVRFLESSGSALAPPEKLHAGGTEVTIPLLSALVAARDYFVVEVRVARKGAPAPRTFEAHLIPATDAWRVVGLMH